MSSWKVPVLDAQAIGPPWDGWRWGRSGRFLSETGWSRGQHHKAGWGTLPDLYPGKHNESDEKVSLHLVYSPKNVHSVILYSSLLEKNVITLQQRLIGNNMPFGKTIYYIFQLKWTPTTFLPMQMMRNRADYRLIYIYFHMVHCTIPCYDLKLFYHSDL